MASRDSKKQIKNDIKFLNEMQEHFNRSRIDKTDFDYLGEMIQDWKDELEAILLK